MTLPTTLPRSAGDARCAAYGMRICATIELIPTTTDMARNTPKFGARPAASSAAAVTSSVRAASARFSSRSPSGTSRNRPSGVSELGQGDHELGAALADAEGRGDAAEQRL